MSTFLTAIEWILVAAVGLPLAVFALELLIYPVIYTIWKWHSEVKPALARVADSQA